MRKILLTTLGYTENLIDVQYFHYQKTNGEKSYCTGISAAEAGAKLILSGQKIDEIIVIGAPDTINDRDTLSAVPLNSSNIPLMPELSDFSEYSFFCYRLQQYFKDIDIEANDIDESVDETSSASAKAMFLSFRETSLKNVRDKDLFQAMDALDLSEDILPDTLTKDQKRWLFHSAYRKMDSFYKLHPMTDNRSVLIRFIPLEKNTNDTMSLTRFSQIISGILKEAGNQADLFIDLQGLDFFDGFSLFNLLSMLRNGNNIRVADVIRSTVQLKQLSSPILNEMEKLEIHDLRTGINIFTNYGKSGYLQDYFTRHPSDSPETDRIMMGMQYTEEGLSLCNIPMLQYGLSVIRTVLQTHAPESSFSMTYQILSDTLKQDFGNLISGDEIRIVDLLKWALEKGMYQQAMTIVESQIPEDMAKRGVYYYAQTEKDISALLENFNVHYWNEVPKNRYQFENVAHYFVKSYGRSMIGYSRDKDKLTREFTRLRIRELYDADGMIKAYSNLHDDAVLYELLYSYYKIGLIRNQVCHAIPPREAMENGEELMPSSNLSSLRESLWKFFRLYEAVLKKLSPKDPKPLVLDDNDFKTYRFRHRLKPFEKVDESILENSCSFDYDGKDISIIVRMLKPQDDPED